MILVSGKKIDTSTDGYLMHPEDWSEEVALYLSGRDNLQLTESHWGIIEFVRQYFTQYGISPNLRTLQKLLKEKFGEQKPDLKGLFPYGDAAKQAARYAGLPRPTGCV